MCATIGFRLIRNSISDTFHELAVEKAVRWRKERLSETIRLSSVTSDATWTPDIPEEPRSGAPLDKAAFKCFASHGDDGHSLDHRDASYLINNSGVWIGDDYDEHAVITAKSLEQVEQDYYNSTGGGETQDTDKRLCTNQKAQDIGKKRKMSCAACLHSGSHIDQDMKIELASFDYLDMERSVSSIFPNSGRSPSNNTKKF